MTPESTDGPGAPQDDSELGAPIAELQDVSWSVGDRFTSRVRNRIERRVLAATSLELLVTAPALMLLEFLTWPLDRFTDRRP